MSLLLTESQPQSKDGPGYAVDDSDFLSVEKGCESPHRSAYFHESIHDCSFPKADHIVASSTTFSRFGRGKTCDTQRCHDCCRSLAGEAAISLSSPRAAGANIKIIHVLGFILLLLVFIEFLPHLRTFVFVPLYLEMKSTIAGYEPSIFAPWFEWPAYHVVNGHCVACHLSSGYWSENPVLAAIALGCKSVQADVWHFNNDLNLLVGRSKYSLTQNRTLAKTYVEQIVQILDASNLTASSWQYQTNGMALGTPAIPQKESLILVIDFKTDGEDLWPLVSKSLDPLRQRDCVTYFNGTDVVQRPVTIVVTGKAPYHKVVESAHYRDMFFDAPLERMAALVHSELRGNCSKVAFDSIYAGKTKMMGSHQPSIPQNPAVFSQANAYFASASGPISFSWHLPYLSTSTRLKIRHQVSGAHTRGLKVRLSIAGFWPTLFNKHLWQILAEEGVDYFSINDRQGAIQWAQMSTGKDQA